MPTELKPNIHFKRLERADQKELELWIERYYAYDHIPFDRPTVEGILSELLNNDRNGLAYFVNHEVAVVGYFILTYGFDVEFGGRHATVTDLFFLQNSRGLGLGKKTMEFIQALLAEKGIATLVLQVENDNHEAQQFYQKLGFKTLDRFILRRDFKGEPF